MSVIDHSEDTVKIHYKFNGYLKEFNSARQNIKIVNTEFGQSLFLDDSLQSTEKDEYIYHETIVHSLLSRINAEHILILGGSEGYLGREVLKWPVKSIDQVDWDEDLVNFYKSNGLYDDPRINVFHEDALEFLSNNTKKYDAIFIDLIDPEEDTLDFFKDILKMCLCHLSSYGGIIANVGSVSPIKRSCADELASWLKDKIENRRALCIHVPSFMQPWCFLMGSGSVIEKELPETKFFDKDTVSYLSKWSKDYSSDLRLFSTF